MLAVTLGLVLWAATPGKTLLGLHTFQGLDAISCSLCLVSKALPKEVWASIRKWAFSERLEVTIQMFHDAFSPLY